jgi:hypothetical protein
MDFKGQTAVLSAILVLVGMIFLVPVITEKALAKVIGTATGTCGPGGQTQPCQFTYLGSELKQGVWTAYPTSGTEARWDTAGGQCGNIMCNEEGSVLYKVGGGEASLHFYNPSSGKNDCYITIVIAGPGKLNGSCRHVGTISSVMTYTLQSAYK